MSFTQFNLDPNILKALDRCGYKTPTPVQSRAIPEIMAGKDLVASAQTGTGKTAAFVLPALHRLSTNKTSHGKPRILILTPTRELANQITDAVDKYGKFLRCHTVSIVGGVSYTRQFNALSKSVDILVATPGRLLDHMGSRRIDLSQVEVLVLDEADRMLDMGFIDDVREIAKATNHNRQTLLFSATIDNNLSHLIQKLLKNPVRIDLSQEIIYPRQIKQEIYLADNIQHKTQLLEHFLANENIYKAVIFSATKAHTDTLARQLCKDGFRAAALHGDLKQGARNRTIEEFRRGKIQYLVATDVASRGIDVQDITHVINYDLPKFFEDYVHRIGRTGRAGKAGIAISFASPTDAYHLKQIERFIKQKLEIKTVPGLEAKHRFGGGGDKKQRKRSAKKWEGRPGKSGKGSEGRFSKKSAGRFEKRSEGRRDEQPEGRYEKRSIRRSDERSEGRFGKRPEHRHDERPEGRFGKRPEHRHDARPEGRFEKRPKRPHGEQSEGRLEKRSERPYGERPEGRFGKRPEHHNDARPEGRFEKKSKRPHGERSEGRFEKRSERLYGERPEGRFGKRPEHRNDERLEGRFEKRPKRHYDERSEGRFEKRPKRPHDGQSEGRFEKRSERPHGERPEGRFEKKPKRRYDERSEGRFEKRSERHPGEKPEGRFGKSPDRNTDERSEGRFSKRPKRRTEEKSEGRFGKGPEGRSGGERSEGRFGKKPEGRFSTGPKKHHKPKRKKFFG